MLSTSSLPTQEAFRGNARRRAQQLLDHQNDLLPLTVSMRSTKRHSLKMPSALPGQSTQQTSPQRQELALKGPLTAVKVASLTWLAEEKSSSMNTSSTEKISWNNKRELSYTTYWSRCSSPQSKAQVWKHPIPSMKHTSTCKNTSASLRIPISLRRIRFTDEFTNFELLYLKI